MASRTAANDIVEEERQAREALILPQAQDER
jgi:hypothetical protein